MFKRGDGLLASVLIPTRNKPKLLCETIDSVYSLAKDKSLFEFILKVDCDDFESIKVAQQLSYIIPIKTLISPRGNGYYDIHLWLNDMCAISTSDWLFFLNDDARMMTQDWDQILLETEIGSWSNDGNLLPISEICMLALNSHKKLEMRQFEFMMLRRKVYEILGHFSLSPCMDAWLDALMSSICAVYPSPITIDHSKVNGDEIEQCKVKENATLFSPYAIRKRLEDANKLLQYIESL